MGDFESTQGSGNYSRGRLKDETTESYYHPLPQNYHEQERWCEKITKMLKT